MRKFSLFAVVLLTDVLTLTGCWKPKEDCSHSYYWYLKNGTESDMVVEFISTEPGSLSLLKTIAPEETVEIRSDHYIGGCGGNTVEDNSLPDAIAMKGELSINGKLMPVFIWKLKYWEFNTNSNYDGSWSSSTLTITDDFLDKFGPYTSNYIFKNNTSDIVEIISYSWGYDIYGSLDRIGQYLRIATDNTSEGYWNPAISDGDFPAPLDWGGGVLESRDSTIVMMGNKRVIHYRSSNDPLYRNETYTLVSEDKYNRTYEFTFTDEFFENAETIE